jgi:hypothetical protein
VRRLLQPTRPGCQQDVTHKKTQETPHLTRKNTPQQQKNRAAPTPPAGAAPGASYRASVLPPDLPVITLEASPEKAVLETIGFTPAYVAERIRVLLGRHLNERN